MMTMRGRMTMDQNQQNDPPVEPVDPPPNPWARLEEAGIDPNDPHLLDTIQWGRDIQDHSRRAQAIEYLIEQDPSVRQALEQRFATPAPEPDAPVNPFTPQSPADPQYYEEPAALNPDQIAEWVRQEAQSTASQQMEEFKREQQEQRLGDMITNQVQSLAASEGLSQAQAEEVFNRTWMNIQQGRVDQATFPQAAHSALGEIRGLWNPPPAAGDDPVLEAGQRYAQGQRAPMVATGQGPAPAGDQPINSIDDAAATARRIIAENRGAY